MNVISRILLRGAVAALFFCGMVSAVSGQLLQYNDPCLYGIYPLGGQRGTTVTVTFNAENCLTNAKQVVVEGAPGITVREIKPLNAGQCQATLEIAADAPLGRRQLRVVADPGITNPRPFVVGELPEILEVGDNNTLAAPQIVSIPAVINGQVERTLDLDCFQFEATAGQTIVAAVRSHDFDAVVNRQNGFVDLSVELLAADGRVLATAEDTLGLDPILEYKVPATGNYLVRIKSLGYLGTYWSSYRLTLGDVPYILGAFPSGGVAGTDVPVELVGFNLPADRQRVVSIPAHDTAPLFVSLPGLSGELRLLAGEFPEVREEEAANPQLLSTLPVTVQARFQEAGELDVFQVQLEQGAGIVASVTAQRHLRSRVDTVLEIYDATGKKLAENDDGVLYANETMHDYAAGDSWLTFTAPATGLYQIRLRDQAATYGPLAIYQLNVKPLEPEMELALWPDAVPIWGPGSTATCLIQILSWGGMDGDVEFEVEGLPPGWKASRSTCSPGLYVRLGVAHGSKSLMTITAPPDAPIGTVVPFRVIARGTRNGQPYVKPVPPYSLLGNSHNDRMHLRPSGQAWACVAQPMDCRIETTITEIEGRVGQTVQIPVKVIRQPDSKSEIGLVVDSSTNAVRVGISTPYTLKPDENELLLPLKIPEYPPPGIHGIVVSRAWGGDIRGGRSGPCSELIRLKILPAQ